MFFSGKEVEMVSRVLNVEWSNRSTRFEVNNLSLNVDKTNYMIFRNMLKNTKLLFIESHKVDNFRSHLDILTSKSAELKWN